MVTQGFLKGHVTCFPQVKFRSDQRRLKNIEGIEVSCVLLLLFMYTALVGLWRRATDAGTNRSRMATVTQVI